MEEQGKELWGPIEGETSKAYFAFCGYRDLGPLRSYKKAHDILNVLRLEANEKPLNRLSSLKRWGKKFHWLKRAQLYDEYLQHKVKEMIEARREENRQFLAREEARAQLKT